MFEPSTYTALQGNVTLVFFAALILSFIGFILLVITVIEPSHTWTVLLIVVVVAGLICFGIDMWNKHKAR
ncbi:hypothetical protein N24_2221 [Corynebacterium suranareeae]|uniref:Uncharacterized protein n=1 Tax=Corynebacterium suranareeae TaxID=2506452 RepID=A0A160PTB7_9CORY|nr:hypothetical protein N24_2221 [Corynebacterium suranareeae]